MYRRDLDGLRALAISAVLLNHLNAGWLPAGFIGVDVFFVLSGYLITGTIARDIALGQFSYSDFYWRRGRRIVPALVTMLAGTSLLGAAVMTSPEFESMGKHTVAAGIFGSNILAWREIGYFDSDVHQKPLLHLWSLGVEEQFYVLWPLVAGTLFRRYKSHAVWALVAVCTASLAISAFWGTTHRSAGFYLLPSRLWELGAGGALSVWHTGRTAPFTELHFRKDDRSLFSDGISIAGLLLLLNGFVHISSQRNFPGLWALLPVSGTLLVIAAGPNSIASRWIFSKPAAVALGRISYPTYLWHWPLISFVTILSFDFGLAPRAVLALRVVAGALAVLLAGATYLCIEKPIRRVAGDSARTRTAQKTLTFFGVPLAIASLLGGVSLANHGFPQRYRGLPSEIQQLDAASKERLYQRINDGEPCRVYETQARPTWCAQSDRNSPTVALVGDSHAAALYSGLVSTLADEHILLLAEMGCPPLLGLPARNALVSKECQRSLDLMIRILRQSDSLKTVIVSSRGALYLSATGFGAVDDSGFVGRVAARESEHDRAEAARQFKDGLSQFLEFLLSKGVQVVLVQDIPELGFNPRDCLTARPFPARAPRTPCGVAYDTFLDRQRLHRRLLSEIAQNLRDVILFDAASLVCQARYCEAIVGDTLLYADDDHLSLYGSNRVARALAARLPQLGNTKE